MRIDLFIFYILIAIFSIVLLYTVIGLIHTVVIYHVWYKIFDVFLELDWEQIKRGEVCNYKTVSICNKKRTGPSFDNLFMWRCKDILEPEEYELLKPYLKRKGENVNEQNNKDQYFSIRIRTR